MIGKEELRKRYEKGATLGELSKLIGLDRNKTRRLLLEAGTNLREPDKTFRGIPPEKYPEIRQKIVECARTSKTWKEVATKLGWTNERLRYWRLVLEVEEELCSPRSKETLESLVKSGKRLEEIARELRASEASVRRHAKRLGLKIESEKKRREPEWVAGRNLDELHRMMKEAYQSGKPITKISEELSMPMTYIYRHLLKDGVLQKKRTWTRKKKDLKPEGAA